MVRRAPGGGRVGLDVHASGKAVLIVIVLVLAAFFFVFAPGLIAWLAIVALLALIAYAVWIAGVRVNRRVTGRRRPR